MDGVHMYLKTKQFHVLDATATNRAKHVSLRSNYVHMAQRQIRQFHPQPPVTVKNTAGRPNSVFKSGEERSHSRGRPESGRAFTEDEHEHVSGTAARVP